MRKIALLFAGENAERTGRSGVQAIRRLTVLSFLAAAVLTAEAQQEAVLEEVIVEAPFDVRLQLPNERHVQIMIDRLLLKAETQRALELSLANRDPLSTILNLTRYVPIPLGSSQEGTDAFLFRNVGRNPLEPPKRNPLFD